MIKLLQGDCREVLKTLPDCSVQCCVTSPPYYGLRDYGTAKWEGGDAGCEHTVGSGDNDNLKTYVTRPERCGEKRKYCQKCGAVRIDSQLGLEPTPEEYVANLVAVFREVRRVLKDDGTVFLNLGDSYFSGAQRVNAYGTSDKVPEDYPSRDCLCESLCDVCRKAYLIGKSRNDNRRVPTQSVLPCETNRENTELQLGHLPTSDSLRQEDRNVNAILDSVNNQVLESGQPLAFQESKPDESTRQLPGECWQKDDSSVCPLCGRTSTPCAHQCAGKLGVSPVQVSHTQGNELHGDQQERHSQCKDTACECYNEICSYRDYTTTYHNVQLKPKDLIGIPWRVAFALQADGWWLRQDIIWHKPNPMPESVTDRCTKSHEYVFLLTKSARYYYDNEAVKESAVTCENRPAGVVRDRIYDYDSKQKALGRSGNKERKSSLERGCPSDNVDGSVPWEGDTRNRRDVWTITTQPYREAHFAVMPEKLVEPCILAGTSEKGCCSKCGAPWRRVVERQPLIRNDTRTHSTVGQRMGKSPAPEPVAGKPTSPITTTIGWRPTCDCGADVLPCVVLDPFNGAGTVGVVALRLGRSYIGIELNPEYIEMTQERIDKVQPAMALVMS